MKKTLAVILSIIMLFSVMPFASFAADDSAYDRAKIAANDEAYIADLTAEQIASVILDWADREIAKYTAEIQDDIVAGVIADGGFDAFEAYLGKDAVENLVAENMPVIDSLDDVVGYKAYLAELGGDFANLDATNLITRAEAGSAIGFIGGVFQFMADNSEIFGKVFRWDEEVFDYGKVGEYIESLDTTVEENKKIVDFYNDYLIGNDIQSKFVNWVATQMNYTPADGETFDDTLNNGIMAWFSGLCETNNILSAEALATLRAYDLRTTDIYALVKNFVGLVQADNQVKIDTYYNYIMDTVVRTLLKTTLGQTATVGAAAEVPAGFTATYKDLALLEEISGGTAYYKDGDAYYQITIADGVATANAITWSNALDINFEPPVATVYTGADGAKNVAEYRPTSTKYLSADTMPVYMYASAQNQALFSEKVSGLTFKGTEVASDYADILKTTGFALDKRFIFKVEGKDASGNDLAIPAIDIDFTAIEAYAEAEALKTAQTMMSGYTVESVNVDLIYTGWKTADEFVMQVNVGNISANISGIPLLGSITVKEDTKIDLMGSTIDLGSMMKNAVNSVITNPLITIVADELSGNLDIDDAKALLDFIDAEFAIDADLLDIAGNYDEYDGAVGQVNHILYGLVDMLVSDSGMTKLALKDGDNTNLNANLENICKTANDMMAAAEKVMNDEGLQEMLKSVGIDFDALTADLPLDLLYAIDFSSVEALWVSVINLGLDMIDDGTNETLAEIHAAVNDLANLDAMAVAMADYVLGKCIPDLNTTLATNDVDFALTVPAKTDATAVADGAGKDIIMTKLVDVIYEAAVEGVVLANSIVNEVIGHVEGEVNADLPTVALELGVAKGATWMDTLTALTNRVYDLADGIIIACDNTYTDTFDKIAAVANSILPLGSLASNCASTDGKLALDVKKVVGYLFDDGLEGNLNGFLGLFETEVKTKDVAANCSVTEALINASEHIVDSIFPDTVNAENYVNATSDKFTEITVQEYFTSAENDAVIASNNMDSINARKADLVPAVLNLVVEAGILPWFAKCDQDHASADLVTVTVTGTAATCTTAGVEDTVKCADCGYVVSGGGAIDALGHDYEVSTVDSTCSAEGTKTTTCSRCNYKAVETIGKKAHSFGAWGTTTAPTCTAAGVQTRKCSGCGKTETQPVAAKGHSYGSWTTTKNPACESTGVKTSTCATCGVAKTEAIPATGHSWSAWTVTKEATCTEAGSQTRSCACGKSETQTITASHVDEDKDNECDVCDETIDNSFGAKFKAFFQKIINWFKNLFKKK